MSHTKSQFHQPRRWGAVAVLVALVVSGCAGPREDAASSGSRTKNSAQSNPPAGTAKEEKVRLVSTKGSIGFSLRLKFVGLNPGYDTQYSNLLGNCRVDSSLGLVTYLGATAGWCTVTALQPEAGLGGLGVVSFLSQEISNTMKSGLVGYWPFNSASSLGLNVATGKTDLVARGGVEFRGQGRFGGALTFNGRDGYLTNINAYNNGDVDLPTGSTQYTVSLWMKATTFNNGGLVGWGHSGNLAGSNLIRLHDDRMERSSSEITGGIVNSWTGSDLKYIHDGYRSYVDNQGRQVCCTSSFTASEWVHVAVVYDGRSRVIYYDGKPVASDVPGITTAFVRSNFFVGAGGGQFFGGQMDDVAIWKRPLKQDEVRALSDGAIGKPNAELGSSFVPFSPVPCDQQGGVCEVGDKMPDGGTVFYVGDFTDQLTGSPMKYMSFAPTDLLKFVNGTGNRALTGYAVNCGGKVHPIPETNKNAVGFGRRNTVIISNFCKVSAADEVLSLKTGGSSDWFIPSADELNELCKFAHNQATGNSNVGCSSSSALLGGWEQDLYHAAFLSSSQGKTVSEYLALAGSVLASAGSGWLTAAVAIGSASGALENLKWGGLQAWRLGYDFLDGSRYNESGLGSQVRPIRYSAPGSQATLILAPTEGRAGVPLALSVSGGSGAGEVTYRVVSRGTAKCAVNSDRTAVIATAVGTCTIQATKDGSDSYRVARSAVVAATIAKGPQGVLSLDEVNGKVGIPLALVVRGGKGDGSVSAFVTDAGTAACRMVTPASATPQVVASNVGRCSVSLGQVGDQNFEAATKISVTLTFSRRDQSPLSVGGASGIIDSVIMPVLTGGSGSGAVTYAVVDGGSSGCVVAANGRGITAEQPGICKVTATKANDSEFSSVTSATGEFTFTAVYCSDSGTRPDGLDCRVGDMGPGGGRVFYVSKIPINYADGISTGGRFLEVAPRNWAGGTTEYRNQFCPSRKTLEAAGSEIGTGANNTFLVSTKRGCSTESAIKKVVDSTFGGQSDWFLPSIKELNEVCKFARRQETGVSQVDCVPGSDVRLDFAGTNEFYWSSTETGDVYGLANPTLSMTVSDRRGSLTSSGYLNIRPIRAFGSQKPPTTLPAPIVTTTTVPPTTTTMPINWVCDNSGKRQDGSSCRVGDTGPAGGLVINQAPFVLNYAKDEVALFNVSGGGRYIEIAPSGWSGSSNDPQFSLGCAVGVGRAAIGAGAINTQGFLRRCPEPSGAVQVAANLSTTNSNGLVFDDWFLPSTKELELIATLKSNTLGLTLGGKYWSSTRLETSLPYQLSFSSNTSVTGLPLIASAYVRSPDNLAFVRPVRAFGLGG